MRKALLAILVISILLIPGFNAGNQPVEKKDDFVKLGDVNYYGMIDRSIFNLFNSGQTILQFILSSLLLNFKDNFISNIRNAPSEVMTDDIDQSQEDDSGGYVEIYGSKYYAQSFIPHTYMGLTGIEICVEKKTRSLFSKSRNADGWFDNNGPLMISLKESLNGTDIANYIIQPEDVDRSKVWLRFYFDEHVELGEEYFFVVHQSGGDDKNYYKWYYGNGDCYEDGDGYSKDTDEWNDFGNDFAFRSYGDYTGDEPDGIADHWAVVIGTRNKPGGDEIYADEDAIAMADMLSNSGWNVDLRIDITAEEVKNALMIMKENEDQDDVVLFFFSGHGAAIDTDGDGIADYNIIDFMNNGLNTEDLNKIFDEFASKTIIFNIDSCFSGGFITDTINLKGNGRIILTSSKVNELSWGSNQFKMGYLTHYMVEGMNGPADDDKQGEVGYGEVSVQEAFNYAKPKVISWSQKKGHQQTPQMYDGIGKEVWLTSYGGDSLIWNLQDVDIPCNDIPDMIKL